MGANNFTACAAAALSHVPISWVKHEAKNAGDPCMMQLITLTGFEGYGRYWRLVELASTNPLHSIPQSNEQGYKAYFLGLNFTDAADFERYISILIDLDLLVTDNSGRRAIPLVEAAALSVGMNRYNGSRGGKTAAANRKRKQGEYENSY